MSIEGLEPSRFSPHAPQACTSAIPPYRHNLTYSILNFLYVGMALIGIPSQATVCRHIDTN